MPPSSIYIYRGTLTWVRSTARFPQRVRTIKSTRKNLQILQRIIFHNKSVAISVDFRAWILCCGSDPCERTLIASTDCSVFLMITLYVRHLAAARALPHNKPHPLNHHTAKMRAKKSWTTLGLILRDCFSCCLTFISLVESSFSYDHPPPSVPDRFETSLCVAYILIRWILFVTAAC